MKTVGIIMRREFAGYFATPVAYVVLFFFLFFINGLALTMGSLYERDQSDMEPFFRFLPWVYLLLCPAVSMRLWAEERRAGTIELLLTQPLTLWQAVLGKFIAAWLFVGLALLMTVPLWLTVIYLGKPDNGVILASYIGSFFYAGAFLALGCFTSTLTKSQLIAFLVSFFISFLLVMAGYQLTTLWFQSWAPQWVGDAIGGLSFLTHFDNLTKGLLDLRDILFFGLISVFFLIASTTVLEAVKSK